MKSGNLNFLEPSGLLQTCNRTALPLMTIPTPLCTSASSYEAPCYETHNYWMPCCVLSAFPLWIVLLSQINLDISFRLQATLPTWYLTHLFFFNQVLLFLFLFIKVVADPQRVRNLACLTVYLRLYYFHIVPLILSLWYSSAEELMVSVETYNYHYS